MIKKFISLCSVGIISLSLIACKHFNIIGSDSATVVYGIDDRTDYYQIKNQSVLGNAKATGGLWFDKDLVKIKNTYHMKKNISFGQARRLHLDERFYNQPVGPHCTVFLVNKKTVVTAGHCADDMREILTKKIVFGFVMNSYRGYSTSFHESNVFGIKRVISQSLNPYTKSDYAVLELDRECNHIDPVKVSLNGAKHGDNVYLIGHPSGLPLKYTPNGEVTYVGPVYFKATVDAFAGNSGSPVFNKNNEVVGILVRGATDFVIDGNRYRANRVIPRSWSGEDITNSKVWQKHIP